MLLALGLELSCKKIAKKIEIFYFTNSYNQKMNSNWKKNTFLFLVCQCITLFGSQIVQFAIVWFVTLKTSSGIWVALFSVCAYLPQFFVSFVGGVWADRYNKKRLIIFADLAIAITTLLAFFAIPFISDDFTLIFALLIMCVIRSVGAGIQTPAVNALLPELVPSEEILRFNGINATFQSIVQFAAPAVAGVVLTLGTLRPTLLIDVFTAILGIGLFLLVKVPENNKVEEIEKKAGFFAEIKSGLTYATTNKVVGKLLLIYGLFIFLSVPSGYLSGLFVTRSFGNTYWHLTAVELVGFAAMALGGILMSIACSWRVFNNRIKALAFCFFAFGVMAAVMGFSKNIYIYLVFMAAYGIGLTAIQTTITTILQEKTDSSMQGRIFGFLSSLYSFCYPVGMLIFGSIADFAPLLWIMFGSGVALVLVGLFCGKNS